MHLYPDKATFLELAKQGNLVPVTTDLMADFETPVSVYSKLSAAGPAYLLESIEGGSTVNRYSFIGCNPRKIFRVFADHTEVQERGGAVQTIPTPADPLSVIQDEMAAFKPVRLEGMPRFVGGAVGCISYEYVHFIEPSVPKAAKDVLHFPVLHFMLSDTLVIFDRARQTLRLLVNAHIQGDAASSYDVAVAALTALAQTLERGREVPTVPVISPKTISVPAGNFTKERFEGMVEASKEYIRAGDIIQVVGAQRFERDFDKSPLTLYRALRVVNPSPYMFLYNPGEFALVGASPEVHVRLSDGQALIRPIAGTRPRGATEAEDAELGRDLLADAKERAEHLMLVDLARNDLGRVCTYGSVTVPEYMIIEHYSHVMHIVSQVVGTLHPEKNAYDLMRATFPAGTVSGAPKVRAMQIIAEKEGEQRGPYAGALTYFSYDGNLDSCICIRTALLQQGKLYLQAGAGLVADSVPASEYQETINKAKGMLKAVEMAEQMPPLV
ncbi:MAG: anthranilate synthase component I [Verrucomicrobiota bacterium]|nr:anthranilate synthase component I [Verrucomicrobiota bacterium]